MTAKTSRLIHATDLLRDVAELHDHVQRLRVLLDLQRRQVGGIEARLYGPSPAGTAARRLMALKGSAPLQKRVSSFGEDHKHR